MNRARKIIRECAASGEMMIIVPVKDADGLSPGAILRRTLLILGLQQDSINVHLLSKGMTIHGGEERAKLAAQDPSYIFVLDQGSGSGPHMGRWHNHTYHRPPLRHRE